MLLFLVPLGLAVCPPTPTLRDPDGTLTVLSQNLKFIATGARRRERSRLLFDYLLREGEKIDVLLLSEARLTISLASGDERWCFYAQAGDRDAYRWAPIADARSPGGLVIGVRQRPEGEERRVGPFAGRAFRARATSLAEGLLGALVGYRKGWAALEIDDTRLLWSHTQASYKRDPTVGAGRDRVGRAGQFTDLADDLGRPRGPTLLTGDLNLLAGFAPTRPADAQRVAPARAIDERTVALFAARTGVELSGPESGAASGPAEALVSGASFAALPLDVAPPHGTFAGGIDRRRPADGWDTGAPYDRVGMNAAFQAVHPGTRVRPVEIAAEWLRVSDHLGLEITIPFPPAPTSP